MANRRLAYQRQDSDQTLAEALDEYYAANRGRVTRPSDLPPESAELFRNHDVCHVIFGLDTSLADETMVDMRTLLSCDVGMRRYVAYLQHDAQAKAIFKDLGWLGAAQAMIITLPRIVRAMVEAARMTKRWPWTPPDHFVGQTLAELRREYGIRII